MNHIDIDLSRRDFLGGAGCLVAAASLPVVAGCGNATPNAEDDVFSRRGCWERLSLTVRSIDAGAEKPFSLLHISDTHLTAVYPHEDAKKHKLSKIRTVTFGGRQEEALRDSLAWARDNVDYVVHTGDLIDWQSEANFDLVRKYFAQEKGFMFAAVGNHEYSQNMWLDKGVVENDTYKLETRHLLDKAFGFDVSLSSQVVNGVNFVSLDDAFETVTAEQAAGFEKEIAKGLPIILVKHVPFCTPRLMQAKSMFWRKKNVPKFFAELKPCEPVTDKVTADFIAYLKAQPLLKGILAGHRHIDIEDRFSPTAMQYVVGPNFLFHGSAVVVS